MFSKFKAQKQKRREIEPFIDERDSLDLKEYHQRLAPGIKIKFSSRDMTLQSEYWTLTIALENKIYRHIKGIYHYTIEYCSDGSEGEDSLSYPSGLGRKKIFLCWGHEPIGWADWKIATCLCDFVREPNRTMREYRLR